MSDLSKSHTFYDHFPTPEYLTLSTSGISVTDESIHFIQLRHGLMGTGLKLAHFEKVPLPEGVVESGFINKPEKLTEILADLARRYRLSYVRATLPEERAYLFTASIDKVREEGLRDAVAFIIEENAPVVLAESVFDFDVLSYDDGAGKMRVAVTVLSKKVVDFYLQVFSAAGLTPVSFDIESQAIARAAVPKGDKGTKMIMKLGQRKTGFYIVEDEIPQFTTTLPYGSANDRVADLQTEMRKIFAYWSAHGATGVARTVDEILVCGPASDQPGFVSALMSEAPASHDWANPWRNVASASEKLPPDLVRDSHEFVAAVGLAIPHPHRTYV